MKKWTRFLSAFGLTIGLILGGVFTSTPVFAEPEVIIDEYDRPGEDPDDPNIIIDEYDEPRDDEEEEDEEDTPNNCEDQTGSLAWIVCPSTGMIANIIDSLYAAIQDLLEVSPLSMDSSSPIFIVWQYMRNLTNIVFVIFLIIVIYSQLTGLGLNNYGVKRVLPRLIIAVILVNMSFIICSLGIDISNVIGASLRDFIGEIQDAVIAGAAAGEGLADFSIANLLATIISGGTIAGIIISAVGGGGYIFFMLVIVLLGAVISVISGLITIAARQALVALLVMIAPLAFVAYLLPNTEKWFNKWKDLLFRMLFFYPTFSFLFGASQLIGYTLIIAADSAFGVILGVAVMIFPLFFSWSLMKMSGTILGAINNGVRRTLAPLGRAGTGWALSHAEQRRQWSIANSTMPGAKLRRYLDYRRELREMDTRNSIDVRRGKAIERALTTASSSEGHDDQGMLSWSTRANRYTMNAKRASLYGTRSATALSAHRNTLSGFGSHFQNAGAQRLASAHAEAYLDNMAQEFLTANEAESDRTFLLNEYLKADAAAKPSAAALAAGATPDTYQYNRLIKSAAGGLGHTGESSIMGQVIVGNANIEARRRSEARIIFTKFGYQKPELRGMLFDKEFINDNGRATDSSGVELEDDQYRPLDAAHPSREWQHYIAVHRTTGQEIEKDQYDHLPSAERANYRKVRYFDIVNDQGEHVQRVYEDDAGYMKELITDDITIGDPINRRYLTEIGVDKDTRAAGILRRYHSTISAAMLTSKYKEHAAEVTPMITAQANMGYITSIGQYNIANLQSLSVATKAGAFLQNDKYAIETWEKLIGSIDRPADFAKYFPDEDIMKYRNVNGIPLDGMRLVVDANGNWIPDPKILAETGHAVPQWEEINHDQLEQMDPAQALELKKNLLKHKILPKAAAKLIGMANRNMSPGVLENQKPDTLEALKSLIARLAEVGQANVDPDVAVDAKLNGKDIFASDDPNILKSRIQAAQDAIDQTYVENGEPVGRERNDPSRPHQSRSGRQGTSQLLDQLLRQAQQQAAYDERNDLTAIISNITEVCENAQDMEATADLLQSYLDAIDVLEPYSAEYTQIIDSYRFDDTPMSAEDAIDQIAHRAERDRQRILQLRDALVEFVTTHISI